MRHPTMERLRYVRRSVDNGEPTYFIQDVTSGAQREITERGLVAEHLDSGKKTRIRLEDAKAAFAEE